MTSFLLMEISGIWSILQSNSFQFFTSLKGLKPQILKINSIFSDVQVVANLRSYGGGSTINIRGPTFEP